ncbi:MAG: DNA lyase [Thermoflexales bacterium]|nr:DNA lyase [Thermoflexales bacterium]
MRLWSLHPAYLDTKALVACWREGLLARKVLRGETKGYRHHPQLERFKAQTEPIAALDRYLLAVWEEAAGRGFAFNREKIGPHFSESKIAVTSGQLAYELGHLKVKLYVRDTGRYEQAAQVVSALPNPIFRVIEGRVESWERVRFRS